MSAPLTSPSDNREARVQSIVADRPQCRRVMVAVDESHLSRTAIPHGVAIASALDAELTLVRVIECGEKAKIHPIPSNGICCANRRAAKSKISHASRPNESNILKRRWWKAGRLIRFAVGRAKIRSILRCSARMAAVERLNAIWVEPRAAWSIARPARSCSYLQAHKNPGPSTTGEFWCSWTARRVPRVRFLRVRHLAEAEHAELVPVHAIPEPELYQSDRPSPKIWNCARK